VNEIHNPADVLRKIGLLALIGLGSVIFAGPALAILSVLLSMGAVVAGFAFLGLLIWLPFRIMTGGTQAALSGVEEFGHDFGHLLRRVVRTTWSLISFPFRLAGAALVGTLLVAGRVLHITGSTVAILSGIGLAAVTGATAGAIVGLTMASPGELDTALPLNALAGAAIGAGSSIFMTIHERRRVARQVAA
jgi:hypothetical protein